MLVVNNLSFKFLKKIYENTIIYAIIDYDFLVMNSNSKVTDLGGSVYDYYHELIIEDISSDKSFKVLVDKTII